ncbi:MAG: hypothetical protein PUK16_01550 [Prevotellaceae bacterium]|nr:hypothetical protein [Prevotellaceae bacterium]
MSLIKTSEYAIQLYFNFQKNKEATKNQAEDQKEKCQQETNSTYTDHVSAHCFSLCKYFNIGKLQNCRPFVHPIQ